MFQLKWAWFLALPLTLGAIVWSSSADAEPRIALVIGNSNYGHEIGALPNPVHDARLMAAALKKVGFTVLEVENADRKNIQRSVSRFGEMLAASGSDTTGLFYYAGRGI